jgi:hypothetical protein
LNVKRGSDSSSTYTFNSVTKECKSNTNKIQANANTKTKCDNYSKCKYTGTCGTSAKDYQWLTTYNSDVNTPACYAGVNFQTAYSPA